MTDLRPTLIGAALLAGCATEPNEELPEMPSEEALAACEGQDMGEEDFDWACCDVWMQECEAEGGGDDCMWICNG